MVFRGGQNLPLLAAQLKGIFAKCGLSVELARRRPLSRDHVFRELIPFVDLPSAGQPSEAGSDSL